MLETVVWCLVLETVVWCLVLETAVWCLVLKTVVWCLVFDTVAPKILKRANVGIVDKCHVPRSVHSIHSVQATPTSMTVTEHKKTQR